MRRSLDSFGRSVHVLIHGLVFALMMASVWSTPVSARMDPPVPLPQEDEGWPEGDPPVLTEQGGTEGASVESEGEMNEKSDSGWTPQDGLTALVAKSAIFLRLLRMMTV